MKENRGEIYVLVQGVLVLAVILAPFVMSRPADYPLAAVVAGVLVGVAGLAVVAVSAITMGHSLSPFPKPKPDASLVRDGIIAVIRHPIYSGFVLACLGWSLAWGSLAAVVATVALLVFFDIKARREERWLAARFPEYPDYQARVRKFIPYLY